MNREGLVAGGGENGVEGDAAEGSLDPCDEHLMDVQGTFCAGGGQPGEEGVWGELLEQVEYEAWHLSNEPRRATPERRAHLDTRLDQVLAHDYVPDLDGRGDLEAYVKTLRAWTKPVELPWIPEAAARKAFDHWYEAQHAFAIPTTGRYDAADAKLAWERTLSFYETLLRKA